MTLERTANLKKKLKQKILSLKYDLYQTQINLQKKDQVIKELKSEKQAQVQSTLVTKKAKGETLSERNQLCNQLTEELRAKVDFSTFELTQKLLAEKLAEADQKF